LVFKYCATVLAFSHAVVKSGVNGYMARIMAPFSAKQVPAWCLIMDTYQDVYGIMFLLYKSACWNLQGN